MMDSRLKAFVGLDLPQRILEVGRSLFLIVVEPMFLAQVCHTGDRSFEPNAFPGLPVAILRQQTYHHCSSRIILPIASMQGMISDASSRTAGLVIATIVTLMLVVVILIKCITWLPALHRKARSLPKPSLGSLRKKNRSDPPEPSSET